MTYIVALLFPNDPLRRLLKDIETKDDTIRIIIHNASNYYPKIFIKHTNLCDLFITTSILYPQIYVPCTSLVVCHETPTWLSTDNTYFGITQTSLFATFVKPAYYTPLGDSKAWVAVLKDILNRSKNPITPLCEIMARHGSDKSPIHYKYAHNYTQIYNQLFTPKKDATRIFELGLGTTNLSIPANMGTDGKPGASLYGWAEFFPNATVFGADIDRDILFSTDRIHTYYCDQTKPDIIKAMWENDDLRDGFDLIIDDGYHNFEANVCFFENSVHKLNPNGYYIIEDVVKGNIKRMEKQIILWKNKFPTLDFRIQQIKYHNIGDNNLVIIHNTSPKYNSDIGAVYYINLEHRIDRKTHILEQFKLANIPDEQIHRFNAIHEPTFGMLGCVKSHIQTLELAYESGHEYVAIFEDDFTFILPKQFIKRVRKVLSNYKPKFLHLAYMDGRQERTYIPELCRLTKTNTTSGYIIHRSYIPTLLENFKESMSLITREGKPGKYSLDVYWFSLQEKEKWYGFPDARNI